MGILEKLGNECAGRIINVTLSKDRKTVELEEACDNWFIETLNKSDFGLLIEELKDIHDQMIDGSDV